VSECERKRTLGKPSCRRYGSNKTDLKEKVWKGVYWICLAQDLNKRKALVKKVMNILIA